MKFQCLAALAVVCMMGCSSSSVRKPASGGLANQDAGSIPNCKDTNITQISVGGKCQTSSSFIFERVSWEGFGLAWQGQDNLIWGVADAKTWGGANSLCKQNNGSLPSDQTLQQATKNGIIEVLLGPVIVWSSDSDFHSAHTHNLKDDTQDKEPKGLFFPTLPTLCIKE